MEKNIKEEFISTLSHEIRTPLTSIKGFSQTMLSSWDMIDDDKKKEFLEIILNQSKRLINLVENVLNVAKIDSNSSNLILSKIEINNLIKNCVNILKISNPDFEFNFNLAKNELNCLCDNDKTQQILINILDNAIKYSINSKKIEIKTRNENDFNVISIKNFGNYIEEEKIEKIFEKFYRVNSYINSQTQGSGLGLYIAKNLANKMQGDIKVVSSNKENSVEFLVYLPIYEVEKITKIGV
jgi:signal transduction histidine kinase